MEPRSELTVSLLALIAEVAVVPYYVCTATRGLRGMRAGLIRHGDGFPERALLVFKVVMFWIEGEVVRCLA